IPRTGIQFPVMNDAGLPRGAEPSVHVYRDVAMVGLYPGDSPIREELPLAVAGAVHAEEKVLRAIAAEGEPVDTRFLSRGELHRNIVIEQVRGIIPGTGCLRALVT